MVKVVMGMSSGDGGGSGGGRSGGDSDGGGSRDGDLAPLTRFGRGTNEPSSHIPDINV